MSRCLPYPQPGYVKKADAAPGHVKVPQEGVEPEKLKEKRKEKHKDKDRDKDRDKKKKHKKDGEGKKRKREREHDSTRTKTENGEEKKGEAEDRSKKLKETTVADTYKVHPHDHSKEVSSKNDTINPMYVKNPQEITDNKSSDSRIDSRQDREQELERSILLNKKSSKLGSGLLANGIVKQVPEATTETKSSDRKDKIVPDSERQNGYVKHDDSKKSDRQKVEGGQKHPSSFKSTIKLEMPKKASDRGEERNHSIEQVSDRRPEPAPSDKTKSEEATHLKRKQRDDEQKKKEKALNDKGTSTSISAPDQKTTPDGARSKPNFVDEGARKKMRLEGEPSVSLEAKEKDGLRISIKDMGLKASPQVSHPREQSNLGKKDRVEEKSNRGEKRPANHVSSEKRDHQKDDNEYSQFRPSHDRKEASVEPSKVGHPKPSSLKSDGHPRNGEIKVKPDHPHEAKARTSSSLNGIKEVVVRVPHEKKKNEKEPVHLLSSQSSENIQSKSQTPSAPCQESDLRKSKVESQKQENEGSEHSHKTPFLPESSTKASEATEVLEDDWLKPRRTKKTANDIRDSTEPIAHPGGNAIQKSNSISSVALPTGAGQRVWESPQYLPEFDVCILPYVAKY